MKIRGDYLIVIPNLWYGWIYRSRGTCTGLIAFGFDIFYILLTVHLGTVLVNNQLNALFLWIYLFHFSIRFEQPSAHHQESKLCQYIEWYVSLYVGDCLLCWSLRTGIPDSHLHRVIHTYQMMYWYNWFSWWWALGYSKHVCLFSWRYNPLCLYFHSPVAGFSIFVFDVSWSHTTTRHSR
jgi:hypothetical protein